jgi:hypothetical protein
MKRAIWLDRAAAGPDLIGGPAHALCIARRPHAAWFGEALTLKIEVLAKTDA